MTEASRQILPFLAHFSFTLVTNSSPGENWPVARDGVSLPFGRATNTRAIESQVEKADKSKMGGLAGHWDAHEG